MCEALTRRWSRSVGRSETTDKKKREKKRKIRTDGRTSIDGTLGASFVQKRNGYVREAVTTFSSKSFFRSCVELCGVNHFIRNETLRGGLVTRTCEQCHFSCASCSGPAATDCLECSTSYFLGNLIQSALAVRVKVGLDPKLISIIVLKSVRTWSL